ncbi:MAG TPA: UDP-N-acetylmuramoyl-L-alanyl-D-glutamate--2,6-diaminopimelate ligase [Acidimicrobiia bacterium]
MASSGKTVAMLADHVGGTLIGRPDRVVRDVTHDSRQARAGMLFVAIRGERADGHTFLPSAIQAGAVAVCVDHESDVAVPQIVVDDTRAVLGELAAAVHDHPSVAVDVIGVTGTNGKTTVTHFVESIARHAGKVTGLIGTIHTRSAGSTIPATLTTPEASDFQRLLARMRDEGVSLVAAEVSSHALELGRVRGTRFAVAAFTNLSQDHLDFHGDMASYLSAKKRLFTEYELGTAVVNVDDPAGAELAATYEGELLEVGRGGQVSIHHVEPLDAGHTRLHLETPWGLANVSVPVVGRFNLSNLAVAAACCVAAGIEFTAVADALPHVAAVPGRFEVVSEDDPITVVVDYAHTPEAVATAVETGRQLSRGRVIALIGAGGDRDRAKRPAMGAAISSADLAVITSDNPRSEDPDEIAKAVLSGIDPLSDHLLELDRRRAIDLAVGAAENGDVVLILGRGHEREQDLGSERIPFDDREVATESLHRRRRSAGNDHESGSMSQ